jgi:plastocyanin
MRLVVPLLRPSLAVLLAAAGLAACSESGSAPPAPLAKITPVDAATAGSIAVAVEYDGPAPAPKPVAMNGVPACAAMHPQGVTDQPISVVDGKLANAVVFIKTGFGARTFAPPTAPAVIDQKGCLYDPPLAAVMVGQSLQFRNSDAESHNVHGRPQVADAWNFLMSRQGAARDVLFTKPELGIPVDCDIHPWMHAYVSVFDNPYFGITGADGSVVLKTVPPGTYVVGVWHPTLGSMVQPVTLEPSGTATVTFSFQPPAV